MRKQRIDIINVHYPTDCFAYLAVCSRLLSVPLVTSIHGADIFPDGKRRARYSREFGFLLASSQLIIAPSKRLRDLFVQAFPALAGKASFVHNGVDLQEMDGLRCMAATAAAASSAPYILCVSAYKEQKAIDVLIHAFSMVRASRPSLHLVLVGGGYLREELQALAARIGVQDHIEFRGPQSRSAVAALLRGCEIFVLPSRFETFGIVILEAMACEKVVVATSAGGIPEIVESGVNGLLVEPDNAEALAQAIDKVLSDEALRIRLAANGSKTARDRFDFAQTGASYETAFERLLNPAGARTPATAAF
jgi:glycosyltransferase involved in cell wall biosynthesis